MNGAAHNGGNWNFSGNVMFIVRSAFWLTAAFVLLAPSAGMDIASSARSTGEDLVSRGGDAVASHIEAQSCASMECRLGKSLALAALPQTTVDRPAPADPVASPQAPVPPARPSWAY